MKIQVGQRERVDPGLKGAMALVEACVFLPESRHGTRVNFDGTCSGCGHPAPTTLAEEIETGKIWLEGLDNCSKCGKQLSSPNAGFTPLTQEYITRMFGAF